jgi:MoaA/NifB/PqqE/SkfB family radical SAM enzyme
MLQRFSQKFTRKSAKRPYKLFQIEPSLECTLECVMCPWAELREPDATMSRETFDRIAAHLGLAESVDFTGGGEPLKNPRLPEMVHVAKQAGCQVGFSTNAMRLTPEISRQLLDAGQDWISFSVDAASAELYERIRRGARFKLITGHIAALRDLKARRKRTSPRIMMVFVMMTGEQQNYPELPEFIRLAHELGAEQVIAKNLDVIIKEGDDQRRTFYHDRLPDANYQQVLAEAQVRARELGVGLRLYEMQPREVTICEHNPLQGLFFNWKGDISPCITLSYAENRVFDGQRVHVPCLRFGDINQENVAGIWDKPAYRQFRLHYEARLQAEKRIAMTQSLGLISENDRLPPAPPECQTCYYLYGI